MKKIRLTVKCGRRSRIVKVLPTDTYLKAVTLARLPLPLNWVTVCGPLRAGFFRGWKEEVKELIDNGNTVTVISKARSR